jgi:hypothetical protein
LPGGIYGRRSGPARIARSHARTCAAFSSGATRRHVYCAVEDLHRYKAQCRLVGTMDCDFEQVNRNGIAQSPKQAEQFDKLSPDQQAARLRIAAKFVAVFGYGSPAFILLYCLIGSVVVWLVFKVGAGAETTFSQAYAITMYAWLPGILQAILATISLFAGVNPEGFDMSNPAGTNLAYYLDPATTGKFVRSMASALDVFSIWSIILVGIGFSCTSKVKRSNAIILVAVCYLIYKLFGASMAAAFS